MYLRLVTNERRGRARAPSGSIPMPPGLPEADDGAVQLAGVGLDADRELLVRVGLGRPPVVDPLAVAAVPAEQAAAVGGQRGAVVGNRGEGRRPPDRHDPRARGPLDDRSVGLPDLVLDRNGATGL